MRALIKLVFLLLLLAVPLLAGIGYLALAEQPLVNETDRLAHEDIARAKAVLKENDPRRLPPGGVSSVRIAPKTLTSPPITCCRGRPTARRGLHWRTNCCG